MHRQYHKFYAVHVYLQSIHISLVSTDLAIPPPPSKHDIIYEWSLTLFIFKVKDFPSGNVGSFSSTGATGTVGHYTQLVWGQTKKIGCGFVMYLDVNQPTYPYRQVNETYLLCGSASASK